MAFEIGQRVGDYEIVQLLGVGGMGHVYRVRNVISDRTEAMKVLLPDLTVDRDLAIRFISEIRTLASFDHPNIALLHTAFQSDNQLIMMMEFVEGSTLEQKAKQSSMSIEEVCGYTYQALSALSYAHGRGVVHRDIKPANLMLTSHGIVKLMDFGIAKSNVETNLTRPGTTIGSLYYMSPEQVRGDAVDGRSDLYSVGIMLYELLAGRRPFEADTTFSILNQQLNTPPRPPIELNPSLPRALNDVILHALAKSPDERYQSADNFKDALRPFCPNQSSDPGHVAASAAPPVAAMAGGAAAAIAAVEAASTTAAMRASVAETAAAPPPPFAPVAVPSTTPPPPSGASAYPPASGYPSASGYPPSTPRGQKSHKGLWIGTGIAAAILAMVGLAIGLPHLMGTHASVSSDGSQAATPTSTPGPASAPATAPANTQVESQTSTAPGGTQSAQTGTAPSGTQQGTQPSAPVPDSSGVMNGPSGSGGRMAAKPGSSATMRGPSMAANGPSNRAASIDAAGAAPDVAAARPNVSAAQLEEAQSHFTELTSRAGAVDDSLTHLRREQEASGYGLRGDMASADNQLQSYLRAADQDLRSSNLSAAKKDMARAEQALVTLEKFLGK
ncbi:MAG: serine/threonine-protein kinase [Granulicella sp.]